MLLQRPNQFELQNIVLFVELNALSLAKLTLLAFVRFRMARKRQQFVQFAFLKGIAFSEMQPKLRLDPIVKLAFFLKCEFFGY